MNPIGIFGGTFDPIHFGHLRTAFELLHSIRFSEIRFIPARELPNKASPIASAELRLQMAIAATSDESRFKVDDREIRRPGPSFTIDTLRELNAEFPSRPLCLIVGMDAFAELPAWKDWRQFLELAHIVVAHRPGCVVTSTGPLGPLLVDHATGRIADLHENRVGRVLIHPVTQLEISSRQIREAIILGENPRFLVPKGVCQLIEKSDHYQTATQCGKPSDAEVPKEKARRLDAHR